MRTKLMTCIVGVSLIASAGCATKRGTGAAGGAVAGGIVGGVLGGETGLLIGAALGGALGYTIGSEMERADRQRVVYALERNEPVVWRNPDTGYRYRVEPTRPTYHEGRQCREFQLMADDGRGRGPDAVYGVACRTPGGDWELVQGG